LLMFIVFVLGYMAIAFEHPLKIDKAASALLTAVICWTIYAFAKVDILGVDLNWSLDEFKDQAHHISKSLGHFAWSHEYRPTGVEGEYMENTGWMMDHFIPHELAHHLSEIAQILFFLLGAMTIVELIDAHEGFAVITDRITTTKRVTLIWTLSIITFFLSAALDNLTTAIVMSALLKKIIKDKNDIWFFAGIIIIAANAGGAWSPIGDVTTIMLWIGGQVTAGSIVTSTLIPSMVCLLVPLIIVSFTLKGNITPALGMVDKEHLIAPTTTFQRNLIFGIGVSALLFVPVFKTITHLPPFMGILFGLGVLWVVTEIIHKEKNSEEKSKTSVIGVLRKIDTASVLFFLGILIAVASLQSAGHLEQLAILLEESLGNIYVINLVIGVLSSIVDNVPLVAGAMGMYEMTTYPVDHDFWKFLAYCAGTGGSCLIIGSAAGVAAMGILKIDFIYYVKNTTLYALAGYLAGAATYYFFFANI
ncbi:MAG: sodium:proton antiporter NhaD, partial [Flavobacteriales bacterium]|nr:sodium:proton antiporter NhaD [Flavobacteriales bacterium]